MIPMGAGLHDPPKERDVQNKICVDSCKTRTLNLLSVGDWLIRRSQTEIDEVVFRRKTSNLICSGNL